MKNYSYQKILDFAIPKIKEKYSGSPIFIPIAGPDAAGKTTFATKLAEELGESVVLRIDNYLINSRDERITAAIKDGKTGHLLEMHRLYLVFSDINKLRSGQSINERAYNPKDGNTCETGRKIEPGKYIIVESGIALTNHFMQLYSLDKFGIFLQTDRDSRMIFKLMRDFTERGYDKLYEKYGAEAVRKFVLKNLEDFDKFVLPTRQNADLVVDIDSNYDIVGMCLNVLKS